jgi:hypothetical protein
MKFQKLFTLLFLLTILKPSHLFGQGFNNNWYFGTKAGITFSNNPPTALTNGQLSTSEGCVSISNSSGNLLFYSDGIKVWNKNHAVMPNGTGLVGHPSAAQSGIVLPKPGSSTLFYLITIGQNTGSGLAYSIVDMSLDGGLGDVDASSKNTIINSTLAEKVTAIKHANGVYYWIIGHAQNAATYYAYLVDCNGVSSTPVTSTLTGGLKAETWGYITASSDAKKVAFAATTNGIELADFNNSTGVFSNNINLGKLTSGGVTGGHYGVAFSPNNKVLYATSITNWGLWQWDLTASPISSSKLFIDSLPGSGANRPSYRGGALMRGPDGKIYVCQVGQTFLSVINNPNTVGLGCNLQKNAINLNGRKCQLGLPTIVQPFLEPPVITVTPTIMCEGNSSAFAYNGFDVSVLDSVKWVFGDPASGALNVSHAITDSHFYASSGTYNVQFIRFLNCFTDTLNQAITVYKPPVAPTSISYLPNSNICPGTTITLTANGGSNPASSQYVWGTTVGGNDLGTTATNQLQYTLLDTTTFYVSVSANGSCPADTLFTGTQVTTPKKGNQLSTDGEAATCYVSGNSPIHFYHPVTHNYIGAVNPQGRTGLLTFTSYVDPTSAAGSMYACNKPSDVTLQTAYMGRRFTVKPTGSISGTGNMLVYFPFAQGEASNLYTASTSNANPNDNVVAIGGIYTTKFDGIGGLNEEGSPITNCGTGTSVVLAQTNSNSLSALGISPVILGTNYFASFSVSDFSEFFLHGKNNLSPLPIELLSFTANCFNENWRKITWSTATEKNVNYFTVLSSLDGLTWKVEQQVNATGNSNTKQNYAIDSRGSINTTYYRLAATDNDGTIMEYYPISSYCENNDVSWSVFPNPTKNEFSVIINGYQNSQNDLQLFDLSGKLVLSQTLNIVAGSNLFSVNTSILSKGIYLLKLNNLDTYKTIKLVIE